VKAEIVFGGGVSFEPIDEEGNKLRQVDWDKFREVLREQMQLDGGYYKMILVKKSKLSHKER
jgi:hypothetical protein